MKLGDKEFEKMILIQGDLQKVDYYLEEEEKSLISVQVSILGPVGYGPTTLPLRHSDGCCMFFNIEFPLSIDNSV
uniref:Uncharacterized protein n=1 Tax=Nelumbo nucifera TaxID=4432 RepID=A0A822Z0E3_NELNU|nr:TPA_asm: hypothetical protein HUJ06_008604 [Nelumbo nucifera]